MVLDCCAVRLSFPTVGFLPQKERRAPSRLLFVVWIMGNGVDVGRAFPILHGVGAVLTAVCRYDSRCAAAAASRCSVF